MLNIANYYRNASENYNEVHGILVRMTIVKVYK